MEAYDTPAQIILDMMKIHSEVEQLKAEEISKQTNKLR